MPMQSASAKMILRPVEANVGLEVCISAFEPRSLPPRLHPTTIVAIRQSGLDKSFELFQHSCRAVVSHAKRRRIRISAFSFLKSLCQYLVLTTSGQIDGLKPSRLRCDRGV